MQSLDRQLPLFDIKTMEEHMSRSLLSAQMSAAFTTIFGVLALILAAIGIYSVLSYSVRRRVQEIGIRLALGARISDVLRMIVLEGMRPTLLGVGIGSFPHKFWPNELTVRSTFPLCKYPLQEF